jgi:hypothetical protein
MRKLALAAAALISISAVPAFAQNGPASADNSVAVDGNGVSTADQARAARNRMALEGQDYAAPTRRARQYKAHGVAGGGGLPTNGLGTGGGGPASRPAETATIQHN